MPEEACLQPPRGQRCQVRFVFKNMGRDSGFHCSRRMLARLKHVWLWEISPHVSKFPKIKTSVIDKWFVARVMQNTLTILKFIIWSS